MNVISSSKCYPFRGIHSLHHGTRIFSTDHRHLILVQPSCIQLIDASGRYVKVFQMRCPLALVRGDLQ